MRVLHLRHRGERRRTAGEEPATRPPYGDRDTGPEPVPLRRAAPGRRRSARRRRAHRGRGPPVTTVDNLRPAALPGHLANNRRLDRWIRVGSDGAVELRVGKVELGQGILTALAQIAADELGIPLEQVRLAPAHTDHGPDQGLTAGSMSVFEAGPAVRAASANVRALFVEEAARRWGVEMSDVGVVDGVLSDPSGSRRTTYGDLATVVRLDVEADPSHIATRQTDAAVPHDGGLVGISAARLDLPDKIAGRFEYISDLRLPRMLFGQVLRPPSPGARLVGVGAPSVRHP